MANPRIEVEIGAVIDGLQQGFGQAVKIIDTLEKQAQDLEIALRDATDLETIQKLNVDLAKTRSALSQLRTTGIDPLTKATSDYNAVGVNFARLIQDAPFGIIGVSNNITTLAESFTQAKNNGQTFTQALKGIFTGGNLLTLGISALTSAFVVLQQQGFFKTEETAKSLKDRLDEYQESLKGVAAATLKGSQDAQKQIASLRGIELQATNTALSEKQRLLAVEELQKLYPDYFGNLTKEQILNGQVGNAYQEVTKQLLAKAKAQASINQIAENSIKLLTIETKLEELKSKRLLATTDAQAQLDALALKRQQEGFLTQGDIQRYDELIRRINQANESQGEEITLLEEKLGILNTNKSLEENINSLISAGVSLVNDSNKSLKQNILTLEDFTKKWNDNEEAILRNLKAQRQIQLTPQQGFENVAGRLTGKEGDVAFSDPILELQNKIAQALSEGPPIKEFVDKLDTINSKAMELQSAFSGLGSLLGQVFGKNPALGQFLGQFTGFAAKLIATNFKIATANAITGASNAAVASGPAAPFTLPGFIAAAIGVIGSAFALIGGRGGSGGSSIGSSGIGAGTSFTGRGATGGLFQQSRELSGEFVVRGQDLVYVFNEANTRINKG